MSHESLENEPLSTSEPVIRDREAKNKRLNREQTVTKEYRNGMSVVEGEVIEGENVGHKWLRIEGGPTIEGAELGPMVLGRTTVNVERLKFHHASVVLEQGEGAGKDKKGFNSIKAEAIVTAQPELAHDEESLRNLSEGEEQRDDKDRITAKVRHTGDGKVIAEQTSYFDEEGVQVTTGLHREGAEQGKIYETRRAMRPEVGLSIPAQNFQTPNGNIENLRLVSITSDVRPSDQARQAAGESGKKQQTVWLEFQGDWTGK
jgi:hypothetical protein